MRSQLRICGELISDLRGRLSAIGVGPDHLVISAAGNRPAAIPLLLACLDLARTAHACRCRHDHRRNRRFCTTFGASAVVLPEGSSGPTPSNRFRSLAIFMSCNIDVDPRTYGGAALLKLTSGSTGFPKAILTTAAHLIADGEQIIEAMGISACRRSNCGDSAVSLIWIRKSRHAAAASRHRIRAAGIVQFLQQLLLDARRFQARVFPGVPYMFNYFAANPPVEGWPSCLSC